MDAGGAKVTQQLSDVFVHECPAGLQLDDQALINEKIGAEIAEYRAIFVKHREPVLLEHMVILFLQAIENAVLIHFLKMSVTEVAV